MAQIFNRSFDYTFRLGLLGALVVLAGCLITWKLSLGKPTSVGEPVEQPVPFSHKHHVSEDGIDCRYCHTSVEDSSFAGIPPTKTCMTCHSQLFTEQPILAPVLESWEENKPLRWNRVNDLPDFVYFNHSIHIDNGVSCVSCHGRVDRMPLTWQAKSLDMQWCLACHRAPEKHVRPREHVFDLAWKPQGDRIALGKRLVKRYNIHTARLTDCSTCHR